MALPWAFDLATPFNPLLSLSLNTSPKGRSPKRPTRPDRRSLGLAEICELTPHLDLFVIESRGEEPRGPATWHYRSPTAIFDP